MNFVTAVEFLKAEIRTIFEARMQLDEFFSCCDLGKLFFAKGIYARVRHTGLALLFRPIPPVIITSRTIPSSP